MKVISNFKDYYDIAMAHGQDDDVRYVRKTQVLDAPKQIMQRFSPRISPDGFVHLALGDTVKRQAPPPDRFYSPAYLLIAGQAYSIFIEDRSLELVNSPKAIAGVAAPDAKTLIRQLNAELEKLRPPPDVRISSGDAGSKSQKSAIWRHFNDLSLDRETAARQAAEAGARILQRDYTDLHLEYGAPIILIAPSRVLPEDSARTRSLPGVMVLNPRLANMSLQHILPPLDCFQKLENFLSGVVPGRQLPMVSISDKDKVRKKGFDPEYGFRKRPQS